MVETAPSDEEVDPYYNTLDSDEEAEQLRTVSQEEEPCIDGEVSPCAHFTRSSCGMTTHAKHGNGMENHMAKLLSATEGHGNGTKIIWPTNPSAAPVFKRPFQSCAVHNWVMV